MHFVRKLVKQHNLSALPIGAELTASNRVRFRVWAPSTDQVAVVQQPPRGGHATEVTLEHEGDGYFSTETDSSAGMHYRFRLGDDGDLYPDPASRFQPDGPLGPSEVIDYRSFAWTDADWPGVTPREQIIYELHIGTFTRQGTWIAAAEQLPALAALGITLLEVMPIAEFVGRWGWSYDGVNLFAPSHLYGAPDDFRRFVDTAHRYGIGVVLDVVYNHFGNIGCTVQHFAREYISDRYENEWGASPNFDGERSAPVREFFVANVRHWISEYHLDGLRIDATQAFFDQSKEHILCALVREAHDTAGSRSIVIIAESEPQDVRLIRPCERGGFGMDMTWNDDFHHTAMVRATGRSEAYYTDYRGRAQEFASALKWGFLFQGQRYQWQKQRRGSPALDAPAWAFVNYLQNHDQLANSLGGERLQELTSPGRLRALTAVLLLGPGTPLLFQGQEFAASSPFLYFADPEAELAEKVSAGRRKFLSQFRSLALPEMQHAVPDPSDSATFTRCRLDFSQREKHAAVYRLHADLIRLRCSDPCLRSQDKHTWHGAVLSDDCFLMRLILEDEQRLLIVNFGPDLHLDPAPEPLLAPPAERRWAVQWSSEDVCYGGHGTPAVDTDENWRIPSECALMLIPRDLEAVESP
ncbi:MAG TPA: malto-oligosyltrehalose trehalohydrolase [Pirellulales bacterium]|jgi:maltooligosyltrehalose trehalohydrolase|nr:malto-oligosyltrehalose trehalohydrolase [Pirellulales bacterium]